MELNGKVVAITGAYKGLGAALSEAFANKGCKLVLGGRNEKELENFVTKIKNLTDAIAVVMDVRKSEDCKEFIKNAIDKFGRLDILVNNAGILWKLAGIEEVNEEELRDTFETNTFGTIYCSQAAVKVMKKQGNGCIVNIGSSSAVDYKSSHIAYGSSKAAIIGFTGSLRQELKDFGIVVLCISPGGMKTDLFRHQHERNIDNFMEPRSIAEKIVVIIEHPSEEWHIIMRRPLK